MELIALQFILDEVPQAFHSDTNVFVADCLICLSWPYIEIASDENKVIVECPRHIGDFPSDDTPLIPFLKRFPEMCVPLINAHPRLQCSFEKYRSSLQG